MLRNNQNIIRLIAAFIIVFCHLPIVMNDWDSIFMFFVFMGYLAVGVFYFFSGYNLVYGYMHKENCLKGFVTGKIFRVLIPYLVGGALTLLFLYAVKTSDPKNLSFHAFVTENGLLWYLPAIFILYIVFFLVFKIYDLITGSKFKNGVLLLIPVIVTIVTFFLAWRTLGQLTGLPHSLDETLPPCLTVGMLFPIFEERLWDHIKKERWVLFFAFLILYFVSHTKVEREIEYVFNYFQYMAPLFFTLTLVLLFSFEEKIDSKPLVFLSSLTFEMYLFHYLAMRIYRNSTLWIENDKLFIVLYIITLLLISLCFNKAYSKLYNAVTKNIKKDASF